MKYTIKDVDEHFYNDIIEDLKDSYRLLIEKERLFNDNASFKLTPVTRYLSSKQERVEFDFPLAYDIRKLFDFVQGNISIEEDIEESVQVTLKLLKQNPWTRDIDYEIRHDRFINMKIGFLLYLVDLKMKLLSGEKFAAVEVGTMIGVTGQAIINRINRGKIDAEKDGNAWVITNSVAKEIVYEAKVGLL